MFFRNDFFLRWIVTVLIIVLQACTRAIIKSPITQSVPVRPRPMTTLIDSAVIANAELFSTPTLQLFYQKSNFHAAWFWGTQRIPGCDSLIAFAVGAGQCGLNPNDYHVAEFQKPSFFKNTEGRDSISRSDLLLSDAFFSLAHHLKYGWLDHTQSERLIRQSSPDTATIKLLENVMAGDISIRSALESREPEFTSYRALKSSLQELSRQDHRTLALSEQILKIKLNLERLRQEQEAFPNRYILINIPAFELSAMEEDRVVFTSRIIVGSPEKPSPVLSSQIESFIIYPYWTVPRSIATEELLPLIQHDPGYIVAHNFDVFDMKGRVIDPDSVHWNIYSRDYFPFKLRQREGEENTLGIIKFIFKNNYGIYLHDTNNRKLFRNNMRALSHGCIRLEKATALAHYLIREGNANCSDYVLDEYFQRKQKAEIRLHFHEPILTRYFTCWVTGGKLHFYPDCYALDNRLIRILNRP